ncbi:MAG: glycosyltransferase [Akkermansiaceae bacterium]|nr:glycosyltransferase [Akkermansiaceae bacterium]
MTASGKSRRLRVLLISIVPPHNDCGVRIVMFRHLVERQPFDLHVASTADFAEGLLIHTRLGLPGPLQRLRKSRAGPTLAKWLHDYENHIWPLTIDRRLQRVIDTFRPQVILTLAEAGLCHMAARAARRNGIPLACLFLDWFPIMPPHRGHQIFQALLSRRYRRLYRQCDLAICTSDGMMAALGPHPNAHVVYPMPGAHHMPQRIHPPRNGKFRIVYVGAGQSFYGRMLRGLRRQIRGRDDLELVIVGPTNDWPADEREQARADGTCLGFMPPEQAAEVLAGADALLVVMSFEPEQELFMRTSFTTKFLDYAAFHKPIMLWGPPYCTPFQVAKREDAALIIDSPEPDAVVRGATHLLNHPEERDRLAEAAKRLSEHLFHPDRLQEILVREITKLTTRQAGAP